MWLFGQFHVANHHPTHNYYTQDSTQALVYPSMGSPSELQQLQDGDIYINVLPCPSNQLVSDHPTCFGFDLLSENPRKSKAWHVPPCHWPVLLVIKVGLVWPAAHLHNARTRSTAYLTMRMAGGQTNCHSN